MHEAKDRRRDPADMELSREPNRATKSPREPQETQWESRSKEKDSGSESLVSRERLMPSPRPEESHEGVLESHRDSVRVKKQGGRLSGVL
jgi:hypothetical protein